MIITTFCCDRCGKEYDGKGKDRKFDILVRKYSSLTKWEYVPIDLCNDCYNRVENVMDGEE